MDDMTKSKVSFKVNGRPYARGVCDGAAVGCAARGYAHRDEGGCGEESVGLTVIVDGRIVNSCLVPVGRSMEVRSRRLKVWQTRKNCTRCNRHSSSTAARSAGFTPGMVMVWSICSNAIRNPPKPTFAPHSREICVCTGYMKIFESVLQATNKRT